jgi:hypothetical protein
MGELGIEAELEGGDFGGVGLGDEFGGGSAEGLGGVVIGAIAEVEDVEALLGAGGEEGGERSSFALLDSGRCMASRRAPCRALSTDWVSLERRRVSA